MLLFLKSTKNNVFKSEFSLCMHPLFFVYYEEESGQVTHQEGTIIQTNLICLPVYII